MKVKATCLLTLTAALLQGCYYYDSRTGTSAWSQKPVEGSVLELFKTPIDQAYADLEQLEDL